MKIVVQFMFDSVRSGVSDVFNGDGLRMIDAEAIDPVLDITTAIAQ